jgi:probable F420-dependent oxidoreductase
MKFFVTYPLSHPGAGQDFLSKEAVLGFARAAEEAGFDGVGVTDHPAPTDRWLSAGGHDAFDPFVALAAMGVVTERVKLIPNLVVMPYRNPFIVAKAVATVELLTDDRFVLSVGTGYLRGEFKALGVDADERNDLFDEALEVVKGIWTTDDYKYEGRNFTALGQSANPKPAKPVPIWIGGNGKKARQRVADHGQGWNPFRAPAALARTARTPPLETADELATLLDDLWRRVEAADRDPSEIDVSFATSAGGSPGDDDFDASAHLAGLDDLAGIGVTWAAASIPSDSYAHAIEALERFGQEVIAPQRR